MTTRSVYAVLAGVLKELSTELDIHYDDEDFFALTPSISEIKDAISILELEGCEVPEAARHVIVRYNRAHN